MRNGAREGGGVDSCRGRVGVGRLLRLVAVFITGTAARCGGFGEGGDDRGGPGGEAAACAPSKQTESGAAPLAAFPPFPSLNLTDPRRPSAALFQTRATGIASPGALRRAAPPGKMRVGPISGGDHGDGLGDGLVRPRPRRPISMVAPPPPPVGLKLLLCLRFCVTDHFPLSLLRGRIAHPSEKMRSGGGWSRKSTLSESRDCVVIQDVTCAL